MQTLTIKPLIEKTITEVDRPTITKSVLGVKLENAQNAVEEAIQNTANKLGADILATYNRSYVKGGKNKGRTVRVNTELNGVAFNYINYGKDGKEYISKYQRTTPLGTYTVEYREDGTRKFSRMDNPTLGVRDRYYDFRGKVIKKNTPEECKNWFDSIKENKGRCVNRSNQADWLNENKDGVLYCSDYENGLSMHVHCDKNENTIFKDYYYGDWSINENNTGVTSFTNKQGHFASKPYTPVMYYINPENGEMSTTTLDKTIDDLGRDVIKVKYDIEPKDSLKIEDFVYLAPEKSKHDTKLLSGKFSYKDAEGTMRSIEFKNNEIFVDGEEKTQEEMITLINKDNFTEPVNKEMLFEELFKDTLEKNGISNEMFLPKYRGTWENID